MTIDSQALTVDAGGSPAIVRMVVTKADGTKQVYETPLTLQPGDSVSLAFDAAPAVR
jgi:hypothetical protein